MIAQLRGAIVQTGQNSVIIDVGGVGYAVTVSGRTHVTLSADALARRGKFGIMMASRGAFLSAQGPS